MSEATESPAPVTAPPTEVSPPDASGRQVLQKSKHDRRAAAQQALAARLSGKAPAPAAEAAPAPETAATEATPGLPVAEPPKAAEAAPVATSTPAQSESALALAKAQQAALKREREAYEAKQRLKEYEAKLRDLEAYQAKVKEASPLDLLKERGLTYEQLTQEIVEGKYKPASPEQLAIEGTKSEVQKLAEELQALKKEREEARVREVRAQEVAHVAEQIKSAAEQYPLLSAVKWGAEKAVDLFYERFRQTGVQPDLGEVLSSLEQGIASDAEPIFASDAYLKRLLANQEQRDRVLNLLGIKQTQPAQQASQRAQTATVNSPAAIPQTKAADPGTRKTPTKSTSYAQRRAAAVAAIQAKRA